MRLLLRPKRHSLCVAPQRVERTEERLLPRVVCEKASVKPKRESPLERLVLQRPSLETRLRLLRREQIQPVPQERLQALQCPLKEFWVEPKRS